MTDEKFSMTNSQFRLDALVAACRVKLFVPFCGHLIVFNPAAACVPEQ
jgi:hypothetical protein